MPATTEQLLIRFRGICGHIDLTNGAGRKKKRTVLVRHMGGNDGVEHHVAYIEFYDDDVESSDVERIAYSRAGSHSLARIDLTEPMEIRFRDVQPGDVEEEVGFRQDVPHMKDIIGTFELQSSLRKKKAADVDPSLAMGVFDMPKGRLCAGEPEPRVTRFPDEVKFKQRRLAKWSDLYITYKTPLVIELVPLSGEGPVRTITFKDTLRMLTIGNEPERAILGLFDEQPVSGGGHEHAPHTPQRAAHYALYYNLLKTQPPKPHVPIPAMIDGPGCPNNNYP